MEGEDEERKRLAAELTTILFPVLLEIYSASAGPGVRHAALQAMLRMVVCSEADLLSEVLQPAFLASQVAAMLSSQDLKIIVAALQLSETLLGSHVQNASSDSYGNPPTLQCQFFSCGRFSTAQCPGQPC